METINNKIMIVEEKNEKFNKFTIIAIFLIALYVNNIFNKGIGISFLLLPITLFKFYSSGISRRSIITSTSLIAFSIYYAFANKYYGFSESLIITIGYLVSPIVMFLLGYTILNTENRYKVSLWIMITVPLSTTLFSIFSVFRTRLIYGSLENASPIHAGRSVMSLWGDNFISATGMNTYVSLGIALTPVFFMTNKYLGKKNKAIKIIIMISIISSLYITFILANRTGLLILLLTFISTFFFSEKGSTRKVKNLLSVFSVFIFGYILFSINFLSLKDKWLSSSLGKRTNASLSLGDPRLEAWKKSFIGLFDNPTGGRKTDLTLNYAHNLWLDVGYDAGIIPFILLVLFSVIGIFSVIKFLKCKNPYILNALVVSSFTAILVTCFMEPILQGWFYYFTIFCLYLGIIQKNIFLEKKTRIG